MDPLAPPAQPFRTQSTTVRNSAERESLRAQQLVAAYERALAEARSRQHRFAVAARTESEVALQLEAMRPLGWHLLADRSWPGTQANIDLIHIGPGGILVIDVKSWREPTVQDGRLLRRQAGQLVDAQDHLERIVRVAELVADVTAEIGLAPLEVVPVILFAGRPGADTRLGRVKILDQQSVIPWMVRRGSRLTPNQVGALAKLVETSFPPHPDSPAAKPAATEETVVATVVPRPVSPATPHRPSPTLHQRRPEQPSLFDAAALEAALLRDAGRTPMEEWMTFLHPEQVRLVRSVGTGPSRIRGAAGTGKTVVALHRAAYLAESLPGPILVTSFINTLPPVLRGLYQRLSPATSGRVEFLNLHAWASRRLTERGLRLQVDPKFAQLAFNRAWGRTGKRSCLGEIGVNANYWKEEIDHVIKGRGIVDYSDYRRLARVGRRTRLGEKQREAVWTLYCDYDDQLRQAGRLDYNDLLTLALDEFRERPLSTPYAAVIADEVQDLNCQGVRLLREISSEGSRLLVIGDGQQQMYPGGYTLAEAGISVVGRSTVLRVNYRNASKIIDEAARVVAADEFDDLEGSSESGLREVLSVREGGDVNQVAAESIDALRRHVIERVRELITAGQRPADIAVLCSTNFEVTVYQNLLRKAGFASLRLSEYQGSPVDAVKVGTVARAKGLEFRNVILPVHERPRSRTRPEPEEIRRERGEQKRRELFVAMTRARDSLWVGRVAS
ncbi:Part of AAA domain-containing protein [Frankineae bacterium MT45]|nr:Part of AAA domain-containing protein [Frankineae bacterium MT45]